MGLAIAGTCGPRLTELQLTGRAANALEDPRRSSEVFLATFDVAHRAKRACERALVLSVQFEREVWKARDDRVQGFGEEVQPRAARQYLGPMQLREVRQ